MNPSRPIAVWLRLIALTGLLLSLAAPAAQNGDSVETLEARKAEVAADTGLAEDLRSKAVDLFTQAIQARRDAADAAGRLAETQARIQAAPHRLKEIEGLLKRAATPAALPADLEKDPTLERVEEQAREQGASLESLNATLRGDEQELARLQQLPKTVNADIAATTERLAGARVPHDDRGDPPPGRDY